MMAVGLFVISMLLSAFFSGLETGFYRVTRFRLLLDGLSGDRIARSLLWLTNHPALFVATTLVGNNIANYLLSLSIVLICQAVPTRAGATLELLAPVALSPIIFVYCELLPKNLFYQAPNRLLRRFGPLILLFTVAFAPLAALLWALGRLIERLLGQAPLRLKLTLARRELQQVLEEGHAAGILRPAQRDLAQNLFELASQRASEFSVPVHRVTSFYVGQDKAEALRIARRQRSSVAPVTDPQSQRLLGYVRVVDLVLDAATTLQARSVRPLIEVRPDEPHIAALTRLQSAREELAKLINKQGQVVGFLYAEELTNPLLRTG
jgi:putative hemolysin